MKLAFIFFLLLINFLSITLKAQETIHEIAKNEKEYLTYFSFENDLFVGSDDYYTSGVSLGIAATTRSFEESIFNSSST